jgi:hypothetical protein
MYNSFGGKLSMMRKQAIEVHAYRELREVLTLKE